MTLDEKIESARKKKEEGDHIFTSGNFLRAYRRYFKASQILRSCSPDPDSEIKQMLICMALSGAKCAMQLQRFKQASDCIHEIQSAVDERRLVLSEMQVDKSSFPVHTLELNNPKVLLRPDQIEGAKGKNVVIGDPRPMYVDSKILAREVVLEKTSDGKETLKIIVKAPRLGGKKTPLVPIGLLCRCDRSDQCLRPVRPSPATGQIGSSDWSDRPDDQPRTFKPKRPEVGT